MNLDEEIQGRKPLSPIWLVKLVDKSDFNKFYQTNSGYCYMGKEKGKIKVGLMSVWKNWVEMGEAEKSMYHFMNDEELRQIDFHCQSYNIFPKPLKESHG